MRWILRLTALLAVLLVATLATAMWSVTTNSGSQQLWRVAQSLAGEEVDLGNIRGALGSTFEIRDLQINNAAMQISIDSTRIQWQPSALLQRKLHIDTAHLNGVQYVSLATQAKDSKSFSLFDIALPVEVDLLDASVRSLSVLTAADAEPVLLDSVNLSAAINRENITLRPSSAQSALVELTAEALIGLTDNNTVNGNFTWRVRPTAIAPVSGQATLSGNLQNLEIDARLDSPYTLASKITIKDVLTAAEASFSVDSDSLTLSAIKPDLPAVSVSGNITGVHRLADDTTAVQSKLQFGNLPEVGALSLEVEGKLEAQTFTVASLNITKPDSPLVLEGSGNIPLNVDGVANLSIGWRQLQWPLLQPAMLLSPRGTLTVTGSTKTPMLQLNAAVSQPLVSNDVALSMKLDLTDSQPRVALKTSVADFSLASDNDMLPPNSDATVTVAGTYPLLEVASRLILGKSDNAPTLDSVAQLNLTDISTPDFDIKGVWQNFSWPLYGREKILTVEKGSFQADGTPKQLNAQVNTVINKTGNVQALLDYSPSASSLEANWSNLTFDAPPVAATSPSGKLFVNGIPDDFDYVIDTALQSENKRLVLQSSGTGSLSALELKEITIDTLEGTINGNAEIDWKPEVRATANLTAENLNPGAWWNQWPGNIGAEVSGALQMKDDQLEITTFRAKSNGSLREYPVSLDLSGSKTGNLISIEQLIARSGDTSFTANGSISDKLDIGWKISSSDLQSLHPDAKGEFSASGDVKGAIAQPQITATVSGTGLSFQENRIEDLDLTAFVDISDSQRSVVDARLNGRVGSLEISNTSLSLNGFANGHKILLDTDTSSGRLLGEIDGSLDDQFNWRFKLNSLGADTAKFGNWKLAAPSDGMVSAERIQLSKSCFSDRAAEVCIAADRVGQQLDATTSIKNLSLQTLVPEGSSDISIGGSLDADGRFQWDGLSDPVGALTIISSGGELSIDQKSDVDDGQKLLVFEPGTIRVSLDQGNTSATLKLPLAGADSVSGKATLTGAATDWSRRKLQASISINVNDIRGFEDMIPEVDRLTGKINGVMEITGSIASPAFNGDIQLTGGDVELGLPEITIEDIEVQLTGDPLQGMALQANAVSGGGALDLSGNIDIAKDKPDITLALKGQNVQVMNTPQAKVYVTPDLAFSMRGNAVNLTGTLLVPKADISILEIPSSAIMVSGDQILLDSRAEVKPDDSQLEISAKVKTTLGENVNFSGFGLTGRFVGELVSVEQSGKSGRINGEIRIVDGQYKAYGQNLKIDTGRLLFADSVLVTPTIDLRATRQPTRDIEVGVVARGPIQQPEFSLVSSPEMTERNKLSYLLLGRPADQGSSGEKSQLGQLALAFGLGQTDGFTGKLKDQLGVDSVGVETEAGTDAEQESFVLGKYLTPKLYLRYGVGLFEPVNTLRLQYAINERWRIVTESSDSASGGDIYYSIERGK